MIFKRKPLPAEVAAAQASNTCRADDSGTEGASSSGAAPGPSRKSDAAEEIQVQGADPLQVGSADRPRGRAFPAGVLGVQFSRATDAVKRIHPLLYLLLGVAIALLALAAIPVRYVPNTRIAALLAYRRSTVALAGAAALVTVTVVYALA